MRPNRLKCFVCAALVFLACSSANATTYALYTFDSGSGTTWTSDVGWTYSADLFFGNEGWYRSDACDCGTLSLTPHWIEWSTYGDSTARIDSTVIAPSTSSGGSMRITGEVPDQPYPGGYWWLYGKGLGTMGYSDSGTDRMSMYIKVTGIDEITKTGGYNVIPNLNFNIGTYPVEDIGCTAGAVPGGHYYHWAVLEPGAWIHLELDRHPSAQTQNPPPGDDPWYATSGKHYYEDLGRAYFQFTTTISSPMDYWIDEVELCDLADRAESTQNDISISTLWVGYWSDDDKWQISWMDVSSNDDGNAVFEVKWSISPITNANFSSANSISPEYYAVDTNLVRKHNPSRASVWTQFTIPDEVESANNILYFAVKDVSVEGGHVGSSPYQVGDYQDAPSSSIHTIDYTLSNEPATPSTVGVSSVGVSN